MWIVERVLNEHWIEHLHTFFVRFGVSNAEGRVAQVNRGRLLVRRRLIFGSVKSEGSRPAAKIRSGTARAVR